MKRKELVLIQTKKMASSLSLGIISGRNLGPLQLLKSTTMPLMSTSPIKIPKSKDATSKSKSRKKASILFRSTKLQKGPLRINAKMIINTQEQQWKSAFGTEDKSRK